MNTEITERLAKQTVYVVNNSNCSKSYSAHNNHWKTLKKNIYIQAVIDLDHYQKELSPSFDVVGIFAFIRIAVLS